MTLPGRGAARQRPNHRTRRGPDWSVAAWSVWEPLPDPHVRRRLRRQLRLQQLRRQRAAVAAAALRHPSMYRGEGHPPATGPVTDDATT